MGTGMDHSPGRTFSTGGSTLVSHDRRCASPVTSITGVTVPTLWQDPEVAELADEFSLLEENAEEAGLPWRGRPAVERVAVPLPDGRSVSALVWRSGPPE